MIRTTKTRVVDHLYSDVHEPFYLRAVVVDVCTQIITLSEGDQTTTGESIPRIHRMSLLFPQRSV